jgi:hypothetical protein
MVLNYMDKKDINSMYLKESTSKKQDGNVYGNMNGIVDFQPLGNYKLESGLTLNEVFIENELTHQKTLDKIKILKQVVLDLTEEIQNIKTMLQKYGLE